MKASGSWIVLVVTALSSALQATPAYAANAAYKIVTADKRGTYYAIAGDLAKIVAPQAGIDLEVLATSGSAENMKLLRQEPGIKLAIVQADVYQAFVDLAGDNREAARIIRPLRVILPLYNTEIHYVVRADSDLNYVHDLKNARINGGLVGSGAAFITHTLYQMMFNQEIPKANDSFLPNDQALIKLVTDKSIDVAVIAAGQPAPIIAHMKPEAQKLIKFLKFDPANPLSKKALSVYAPATIHASSYPNLLKEDFTTISVGAFLVTYDYTLPYTVDHLTRFARSLCQNFAALRAKGHPKWREVSLSLPPLNNGWTYYQPTTQAIRACLAAQAQPPKHCATTEERILGLCN